LAALARRIEAVHGITVSTGLSYNKFLAKLASDLDKPRGFAVIGRSEAADFLADKPVGWLWGVGGAMQRRLAADGIMRIGQLRGIELGELARRYGRLGARLGRLSHGEDDRRVDPRGRARSISAETTFAQDEADLAALTRTLRPLCETVAARLKQNALTAKTVTLKLKTADFRLRTRSRSLPDPTQFAETLFRTAAHLLRGEVDGVTRFRLIGVGADNLADSTGGETPTLFAKDRKAQDLERAMDGLSKRYGQAALTFGSDEKQAGG